MVLGDIVDTLSRIGAIGGILSIVGVGLLILLVAGQSRQIRSMREWIDEEPQRQQETAQRVIAEVQRRIAAARERRAQTVAPAAAAVVPPAAKGVGSPAPGTLGATPEAQALAKAQELVPATGGEEGLEASIPPPVPGEPPAFAPLTPAGGAPGGAVDESDEPAVVSEFLNQETQVADALPEADLLDPGASIAASGAADVRYGDDLYDYDDAEEQPRSRVLFGVGAVAIAAGIVLLGVLLFGGGGGGKSDGSGSGSAKTPSNGTQSSPKPKATTTSQIDPSKVNVKVLNGTSVSGLAQRVTDKLGNAGYTTTTPDTWSNGGSVLANSTVYYRPNFKTPAIALAKTLGISSANVQAINDDVSVAAGQGPDVVVIIGTDQSAATTTSTTSTE